MEAHLVILRDTGEGPVTAAIEANLYAHLRAIGRDPQVELYEEPDMTWMISDVAYPPFNSVYDVRLHPRDVEARIRTAVQPYKARQVPMVWWVGPGTRPECLGRHLQVLGLIRTEDEVGMAADLQKLDDEVPMPPGLTIRRVTSRKRLADWAHPIAASYGFPKGVAWAFQRSQTAIGFAKEASLRRYVAYLDGAPVAASMLCLAAGVAGIYWVATIPEVRRRGIGTAVTLAPLAEARALGYRLGVLQSTQQGLSLYRRLGFSEYCRIGHYIYAYGRAQRAMLRAHGWLHEAKEKRRRG